jgi:predicted GNAT family acetyltransferase
VSEGRVFLWDDGGAVAQTVVVGATPNGARIGGVYTPETNRRRGYATALVAEVSRAQLAEGRKFCFLFTDLANPTSNSIYPKVGYRAVADFREYDFVDAP